MTIESTYQWMGILVAIGCLQSSGENLFLGLKYLPVNQFAFKNKNIVKRHFNWMYFGFDAPGVWVVYVGKFLISFALLIQSIFGSIDWWVPFLYIFVEHLGYPRQYYLTNSDIPIQRVVLVSLGIHFYCQDTTISELVLFFVSAQLCLAYCSAGWHKLKSDVWRDGSVFPLIFKAYLSNKTQEYFDNPKLNKKGSWLVILCELSFPLSFVGGIINDFFLGVGFLFHGVISISTGINFFFWSFISCYPALHYVGSKINYFVF